MAEKLPSDLVEEIIYRVPCRSLARFKCVCKLWSSLILDERLIRKNFYRMHKYNAEHRFIIKDSDDNIYSVGIDEEDQNMVDLDPLPLMIEDLTLKKVHRGVLRPIKVYKIVHCDGLLLCVMNNQLLVWNPYLKETRWIKCNSDFHEFDDAYSLGYISYYDYRILRFRCGNNSRNRPTRVEVYQLATKTWNVIDMSFDWVLIVPLLILSLRGTPYCIGLREDDDRAFIQSFDFSKETFQTLDYLPFKHHVLNPIALEIVEGDKLSVLEQCHETRKISVWVKDLASSPWIRLMVVDIPHFPLIYSHLSRISINYFVDENNRLVIICVDNGVCIHRVMSDKEYFQTNIVEACCRFYCSCNYVPSLVRLPGFSKQDTNRIRWNKKRFY